ncbi:hypothetical protein AB4090_10685 [Acidithiobacillus sp. IBUN Pt1247-S3]|uniref:hypothetical protein n=1 Tax=Acidithiobacillus sp. IBUN Pt1247-S3 TaxID=3166642 RepID=UPI0034E3E524
MYASITFGTWVGGTGRKRQIHTPTGDAIPGCPRDLADFDAGYAPSLTGNMAPFAVLDRLLQSAHRRELKGESLRRRRDSHTIYTVIVITPLGTTATQI